MVNSGTDGSNTVRRSEHVVGGGRTTSTSSGSYQRKGGELGGDVYFDITVRK